MYLNLRCVMRQWLINGVNKVAYENSLPTKVLWSFTGVKPSNSMHSWLQSPSTTTVGPTKTSSFIGSLKMTSTSYRVIDISPCGRWNVWVSSCHRSTRADIRQWFISLEGALNNPSNLSNLIMSITRLSRIWMFVISLVRPRHVSGPGSCKIGKNYNGC